MLKMLPLDELSSETRERVETTPSYIQRLTRWEDTPFQIQGLIGKPVDIILLHDDSIITVQNVGEGIASYEDHQGEHLIRHMILSRVNMGRMETLLMGNNNLWFFQVQEGSLRLLDANDWFHWLRSYTLTYLRGLMGILAPDNYGQFEPEDEEAVQETINQYIEYCSVRTDWKYLVLQSIPDIRYLVPLDTIVSGE